MLSMIQPWQRQIPFFHYLTLPGTNAWWLGHLTENEDVDKAMQQIADVSLILPIFF